jgi:hypothetical protein
VESYEKGATVFPESLAAKSKLTQKDVDEFSKKVKALGSRRFRANH